MEKELSTELSAAEYWDMSNEIDALKAEVNRLHKENHQLKTRRDRLTEEVVRLRSEVKHD